MGTGNRALDDSRWIRAFLAESVSFACRWSSGALRLFRLVRGTTSKPSDPRCASINFQDHSVGMPPEWLARWWGPSTRFGNPVPSFHHDWELGHATVRRQRHDLVPRQVRFVIAHRAPPRPTPRPNVLLDGPHGGVGREHFGQRDPRDTPRACPPDPCSGCGGYSAGRSALG